MPYGKNIEDVANLDFEKIIKLYKFFSIPAFQRAYAWLPKHVQSMWQGVIENEPGYYVGTLVAITSSRISSSQLQIIDGQQRLTTISIFFIALRDYIVESSWLTEERKKAYTSSINKNLEEEDDIERKTSIRIKFRNKKLQKVYDALIKGEIDFSIPTSDLELDDRQLRFVKNYLVLKKFIKEEFKKCQDSEKELCLKSLLDKFVKLDFILIVCKTESNVYKIFEGLNSTGLELSIADLVKNAVLRSVSELSSDETVHQEAERLWDDLEILFSTNDIKLLPKFLRHQWISRRGYISNSELFDEIKTKELEKVDSVKEILKYEKLLLSDAKSYIGLRTGVKTFLNKKCTKPQIEIMEKLSLLNLDQIYELLLAHYNKYIAEKKYTPKQFTLLLNKICNFTLRVSCLNVSPAAYERIFAKSSQEIADYNGVHYDRKIEETMKSLRILVDGREDEFTSNFASDFKYKKGNDNSLLRYILQRIYSERNPNILVNEPTLDHILPQDPSEWGIKDKNIIQPYVDQIGNLALLPRKINQSLQNAKMEKKVKLVYKKGKNEFRDNQDIASYQEEFITEPEKAILRRGTNLGKRAYKLFAI